MFWAVVMLGSLVYSLHLIHNVWSVWSSTPSTVNFHNMALSNRLLPFPTVTVCPGNKYRRSVFDFESANKKDRRYLTPHTRRMVDDILLICNPLQGQINSTLAKDYPLFTDDSTLKHLEKVAPRINESLTCQHRLQRSCTSMFQPVFTMEGLCYSYNFLPQEDFYTSSSFQYGQVPIKHPQHIWSLETGYYQDTVTEQLPMRAVGLGCKDGMQLELTTKHLDIDYNCTFSPGFKISLTNPAEMPMMGERVNYVHLEVEGLTQIKIDPRLTYTNPSLRNYDPKERYCYFPSERKLDYFNTYTRDNCILECLTNLTLKTCKCVAFFMPKEKNTPICAVGSVSCMKTIQDLLEHDYIRNTTYNDDDYPCHCLPSCVALDYITEISQTPGSYKEIIRNILGKDEDSHRNESRSTVCIFFKDEAHIQIVRSPLLNWPSFIAKCGGLLGLCCGFSVLSLAEILYYFTLRLRNNSRQSFQTSISKRNTIHQAQIKHQTVESIFY